MLEFELDMPPWSLWPDLLKAAEPLVRDTLVTVLLPIILFLKSKEGTIHHSIVLLIRRLRSGSIKVPGVEFKIDKAFEENVKEREVVMEGRPSDGPNQLGESKELSSRYLALESETLTPPEDGIVERKSRPKKGMGILLRFSRNKSN